MITNTQLLNDLKKQLSLQDLSESQKIGLAMRYKQLLIDTLKVGDLIKGTVKALGENSYVLEIRPHVQIPVILNDMPTLDNLMSFIVKEKTEGKLFISSIDHANVFPEGKTDIVDKVVHELTLPKNKVMKEIIFDFINKQLPLDKNTLMKAYYFNKEFNIPTKVLANLAAYEKTWTDKDLKYVQTIRENGLTSTQASIKKMINELPLVNDLKEVFNILAKDMKVDDIHQILSKYISDLDVNDGDIKNLNTSNLNTGKLNKGSLDMNKLDMKSLDAGDLNRATLEENVDKSKKFNKEAKNIISLVDKDIPDIFLKDITLFKKALLALYDKRNIADMHKLKDNSSHKELDKTFNFAKASKEILEVLEKLDQTPDKQREVNALKENIKVIENLNEEGHHFIFPMSYHDQIVQGELYFFKSQKYKKNKKDNIDNIYIVLALDMPHIEHIEIHINKQGKDIYLTFNVIDEEVKKHINKYTSQIENDIESLGYQIKSLLWGYLNKEDEIERPFIENVYESLSHMDIKA